jgi:hypothetical protein
MHVLFSLDNVELHLVCHDIDSFFDAFRNGYEDARRGFLGLQ